MKWSGKDTRNVKIDIELLVEVICMIHIAFISHHRLHDLNIQPKP